MRTKTALLALVTIAASALPLGAAQAQAKIGVVNVARTTAHARASALAQTPNRKGSAQKTLRENIMPPHARVAQATPNTHNAEIYKSCDLCNTHFR